MTTRHFHLSNSEASASTVRVEAWAVAATTSENFAITSPRHGSQAYFWTPEWQQRERLADYDFLIGDTFRPANADDLIQHLHEEARGETDQAS